MKQIIYFKCEKCGKTSEDREEILKCEASHYGLTVSEKQEWDALKDECHSAGVRVSMTNNENAQRAFDDAIEKCIQFEKQHNIKTE